MTGPIEIEVTLHADPGSAAAILVPDDGEERSAVWLPRSQIDYDSSVPEGCMIIVTLPKWLALDKGLV